MLNSISKYLRSAFCCSNSQIEYIEKHKIDFVTALPKEVLLEIFSYLDSKQLTRCFLVNKTWKILASDHSLWNILNQQVAFGKKNWKVFGVDVGEEPQFPKNIHGILNSACPYTPTKKVKDTHILVLKPKIINGILKLKEILKDFESYSFKEKKFKNLGFYFNVSERFEKLILEDTTNEESHWLLMKIKNVETPKNQIFKVQTRIVNDKKLTYQAPTIFEAVMKILIFNYQFEQALVPLNLTITNEIYESFGKRTVFTVNLISTAIIISSIDLEHLEHITLGMSPVGRFVE